MTRALTKAEWDEIWEFVFEWQSGRASQHVIGALPPMAEMKKQIEKLVNATLKKRGKKK